MAGHGPSFVRRLVREPAQAGTGNISRSEHAIIELATKFELPLVEDAAELIGITYNSLPFAFPHTQRS